jgi:hypothetical protein
MIKLSQSNMSGTWEVDLTNNNCAVKRLINNPVFVLNLPKVTFTDPDAPTDSNQIVIDLAMLTDRYLLTFDLTDGVASGSKYRTLIMMAQNGMGEENLTYFDYADFETDAVKIEELSLGTQPGKKDLLEGCSMSLIRYKPLVPPS